MCLLGKSALCLVDHCFYLIQYEAVITAGVFIHFRFILFKLLSCDLIRTMFGARFLLCKAEACKVSILLASLAKVFLCWTGEALCMPGVTTFRTAIGAAMGLRWIEEFLLWWFAILGFEVLLAFVSCLLLMCQFSPLVSEKVDLGCLWMACSLFDVSSCSLAGFQLLG